MRKKVLRNPHKFLLASVLLLLAGCLLACVPQKEKRSTVMEVTDKMVGEDDASQFQIDADVFEMDSIRAAGVELQDGFIYLLNGDCSFCLTKFFDFAAALKESGCEAPVYVIVDESMADAVEYYLSQADFLSDEQVQIRENTAHRYIKERIDNFDLSGVFFPVVDGKVGKPYLADFASQEMDQ